MSALTIEFAGSRYRFAGLNPAQDGLVRSRFQALLTRDDATPDVRIDIHFNPNSAGFMQRPPGPVEYPVALAHGDESIAVAGIGFTANLDRSPLRVQMQTCRSDEWFSAAFENLFRIVACYRLFGEGALVMHSAAFNDGARGFLFCGRSGAGKTTLCGLADELDLEILSDELNAIRPSGQAFELLAMPFAGDFGGVPRRHPPYPLTGLLGLRQGERAVGEPLLESRSSLAYRRLVSVCERRPLARRRADFARRGARGAPTASHSHIRKGHPFLERIGQ